MRRDAEGGGRDAEIRSASLRPRSPAAAVRAPAQQRPPTPRAPAMASARRRVASGADARRASAALLRAWRIGRCDVAVRGLDWWCRSRTPRRNVQVDMCDAAATARGGRRRRPRAVRARLASDAGVRALRGRGAAAAARRAAHGAARRRGFDLAAAGGGGAPVSATGVQVWREAVRGRGRRAAGEEAAAARRQRDRSAETRAGGDGERRRTAGAREAVTLAPPAAAAPTSSPVAPKALAQAARSSWARLGPRRQ